MQHQRRDGFWKQGSVCEDYGAIECPVYMVGGWGDGYTNAVLRFLEGSPGTRKGLIGPWPHAYPQVAHPGPRIGFLHECIRWWDRWLKGVDNGIDREPMLRAWMQEPMRPDELATAIALGAGSPRSGGPRASVDTLRLSLGIGVLGAADGSPRAYRVAASRAARRARGARTGRRATSRRTSARRMRCA